MALTVQEMIERAKPIIHMGRIGLVDLGEAAGSLRWYVGIVDRETGLPFSFHIVGLCPDRCHEKYEEAEKKWLEMAEEEEAREVYDRLGRGW